MVGSPCGVHSIRLLNPIFLAHDHTFLSVKVHTMNKTWIATLTLVCLLVPGRSNAQIGGNANFGETRGRGGAEQRERTKPVIAKDDHPPSATSMFVEANVLMNVRADQYVVIFAIAHDGETLADCARKMDATLKTFTDDIKALGIVGDDVFVDFIAQHKYEVEQAKAK
jgi:hypothetical protein